MRRDAMIDWAAVLLRAAVVLNLLAGVLAVAALVASFPGSDRIVQLLTAKYADRVDPHRVVAALRILVILSLVGVAIVHVVLRALTAVVATVRAGNPFDPANAARIATIGWALLGWQLLDLALGAMVAWFVRLGVDTMGWAPSFGGWLSVLVAFVLARVFAAGNRMRAELDATI